MKTLKSVSRKIKIAVLSVTLVMMTSVILTSCQKEDLNPSVNSQTATINDKQRNQQIQEPLSPVFESVKINHLAAPGFAEYCVTLFANGTWFYEGKSNVAVKGIHQFIMSRKTLSDINKLCIEFTKQGPVVNDVEKLMRMQIIETIYEANDDRPVKVFREYNGGNPSKLQDFRTKTETLLKIGRFLKIDKSLAEVANQK